MALATQCPHCGTTFRVAHDQLKLRAGMVRCGSCQHIFNGIEQLVVAGVTPATPAPAQKTHVSKVPPVQSAVPDPIEPVSTAEPQHVAPSIALAHPAPEDDDGLDFALEPFGFTSAAEPKPAAQNLITKAENTGKQAEQNVELPEEEVEFFLPPESGQATADDEVVAEQVDVDDFEAETIAPQIDIEPDVEPNAGLTHAETELSPAESPEIELTEDELSDDEEAFDKQYPQAFETENEPEFVKRGRRKQKRRRTVRIAMSIAILFLLTGLILQSAYTFRSLIAAAYPPAKPLLTQLCKPIGCQVGLPAQIDNLTIEPNDRALLSLDQNKTIFEFNVLIRNHSSLPQAWPHIELTLNDTAGKAVVRRIFKASEFPLLPADLLKGIPPNSEQTVKLYFKLTQLKASGYAVQVFYP